MLLKLITFELSYHAKQNVFRAACAIYFLMGIAMAQGVPGGSFINKPFALAFLTGILSLGSVIVIALMAGAAILRDTENKMEGIVFGTNLTHSQYVISRFSGLLLAAMTCFSAGVVGLYLGRFMPWVDPSRVEGYQIWPYLWVLVVMALPNLMVGCSVIFATAALTRNSMATYLSGFFLYVLYWVGSLVGKSPLLAANAVIPSENPGLAALLEPYGLLGYFHQTRYWSMTQKNMDYLTLEGPFLYNRLLWTAFSLLLFALTYRLFSFRVGANSSKRAEKKVVTDTTVHTYQPIQHLATGFSQQWSTFVAQSSIYVKVIIKAFPFYALTLLWSLLTVISFSETLRGGQMGSPYLPLTSLLLPSLLQPLLMLGSMAVVFYTAELMFCERSNNMDSLLDAGPGSNLVFGASKLGALAVLIFALISYSILLTVIMQLTRGQFDVELSLYASLYYRAGVPLLAVAVLAITICNFFTNKYVGMGLSFLVVVLFSGITDTSVGLEHPMLRFGFTPTFRYSDMAGIAYHDGALIWYLLYWTAVSGLLATLALSFWRRGVGLRATALGLGGKLLASGSLILLLISGSYLLKGIHGEQKYFSKEARRDWRASYERLYGSFEEVAQPSYTDVKVKVDLFPSERRYVLEGDLSFVNDSLEPMETVLLGFSQEVGAQELTVAGATLIEHDSEFGHYQFRFNQPLQPGATGSLHLAIEVHRSAFRTLNPENYLLPSASYVEIDKVLPMLGYREDLLLTNPRARAKRGLPERRKYPTADDHNHASGGWVQIEVEASTVAGQTLVVPGQQIRTWQEAGRQKALFRSKGPVRLSSAISSAVYETRTRQAGDVTITAYYHKDHDYLVDDLLEGAAASLVYCAKNFGPYQADELRVAAITAFSDTFGGTAYNDTIYIVENRVYLVDKREGGDFEARRVIAHEVAHQWWGHQVAPAPVAGFAMLSEMLAVYVESAVTRELFGDAAQQDYLRLRTDLYYYIRGYEEDAEMPLSKVQFQPYVYYFKGARVMNTLLELMGEEAINGVLKTFLEQSHYPVRPTSVVLTQALIAAAPEAAQADVAELLTQVVIYDLQLISAQADKQSGDSTQITARLNASKTRTDDTGKDTTEAYVGPLEVGLWSKGVMLGSEVIQIVAGQEAYTLATSADVEEISLDPRWLKLNAASNNNRSKVDRD